MTPIIAGQLHSTSPRYVACFVDMRACEDLPAGTTPGVPCVFVSLSTLVTRFCQLAWRTIWWTEDAFRGNNDRYMKISLLGLWE